MAYIYNFTDTWTDGATTYAGIGLDVTDTASAAGSSLMSLNVGGSNKFKITKAGRIVVPTDTGLCSPGSMILTTGGESSYIGLFMGGGLNIMSNPFCLSGTTEWNNGSRGYVTLCNESVAAGSNQHAFGFYDLDAVSAVTLRQYGYLPDAGSRANYERVEYRFDGDDFVIETQAAGTGTRGAIKLNGVNRSAYIASPTAAQIRDIFISFGLMAAS